MIEIKQILPSEDRSIQEIRIEGYQDGAIEIVLQDGKIYQSQALETDLNTSRERVQLYTQVITAYDDYKENYSRVMEAYEASKKRYNNVYRRLAES